MRLYQHLTWARPLGMMVAILLPLPLGCARSGQSVPSYRNDLTKMQTDRVTIKGQAFDVWLALTPDEEERGLMQVTEAEMAAVGGVRKGMLFVFDEEDYLAFWMYNTITALDIAFIDADGRIVKTHTMAPLETRTYPSVEPAMYALEVLAGTFAELGISEGDQVEIPESVLKDAP